MEPGQIACPQCQWPVQAAAVDAAGMAVCPRCSQRFSATFFAALFRHDERGHAGEPVVDAAQAACFYHAGRRATVACDECGRFLCALCDLPLGNRHLCPQCLHAPPARDHDVSTDARPRPAILYDNIALALAALPTLMVWPTLVTAPATLVVVCRYWTRMKPIVPRRSRLRFVLAALIAIAQIGGWVTVGIALLD